MRPTRGSPSLRSMVVPAWLIGCVLTGSGLRTLAPRLPRPEEEGFGPLTVHPEPVAGVRSEALLRSLLGAGILIESRPDTAWRAVTYTCREPSTLPREGPRPPCLTCSIGVYGSQAEAAEAFRETPLRIPVAMTPRRGLGDRSWEALGLTVVLWNNTLVRLNDYRAGRSASRTASEMIRRLSASDRYLIKRRDGRPNPDRSSRRPRS